MNKIPKEWYLEFSARQYALASMQAYTLLHLQQLAAHAGLPAVESDLPQSHLEWLQRFQELAHDAKIGMPPPNPPEGPQQN